MANKKQKKVKIKKVKIMNKKEKHKTSKHVAHEEEKKSSVIEQYKVEVDNADVTVKIMKEKGEKIYTLEFPVINIATAALLDDIRQELISAASVGIGIGQTLSKEELAKVKKRFIEEASRLLNDIDPGIDKKTVEFLIGKLMQDMLGLGEVEFLVNDPNLEEIVIPSARETIRAYHKRYGWLKTNLKVATEDAIINYSNIVARRVGRQITVLTPLLDAHLISGDRTNAVLYPISSKGNTITIRKFARDPYTIIDLIKNNTVNSEISALLWQATEYEMNIIVSGGTASGKTVFLNCCMAFMPPNHRILSIEDTRELMLPDYLYWTPLVTRTPNVEGKGEVSMLDLLINSLRMRPDRIILGEMRRQSEAEVLFEAMHTGHSVYATLHADSASETISRLTNPPINVPKNLLSGVNLNVVMTRDRRKGIRRVYQVAEFIVDKDNVSANLLYRYINEKDVIESHGESAKLFEDLSRHTGMNQAEINADLKKRKMILDWMLKNDVLRIEPVSRIFSLYYSDKERLIKLVEKNAKPAEVLQQ